MYFLNFGVNNRFISFCFNFHFFNFVLICCLNLEKFREASLVRGFYLIFFCLFLLQSLGKQRSLFLGFVLRTILLSTLFFSPFHYRLNKGEWSILWLLHQLLICLWLSSSIDSSLINYLHAWFIIFCELLLELLKTLLFELSQGVTSASVLLHIFIKFTYNILLIILHFIID